MVVPEAELSWRFSRSGGPGGQSVNTSDSRAELRYDVRGLAEPFRTRALARLAGRLIDGGVLAVVAAEERSQLRNRTLAEQRLTEVLRRATAAPPRPRRATKPTRGSVERRLDAKRKRGSVKRLRRGRPDDLS